MPAAGPCELAPPANLLDEESTPEGLMSTRRPPEYLNKALAAKRSGLSVRRLLELAQRGVIRKTYVRDPRSNRTITVFPVEDLDRLKINQEAAAALQMSRS